MAMMLLVQWFGKKSLKLNTIVSAVRLRQTCEMFLDKPKGKLQW